MNKHINIHNIKEIKLVIYLEKIYKRYDNEHLLKCDKLIMPIKNDDALKLYVFHQEKGIVNIEEHHKKFWKNNIYIISDKFSFCNFHNKIFLKFNYLFLTGGEYNNEIINDFKITYNTQI